MAKKDLQKLSGVLKNKDLYELMAGLRAVKDLKGLKFAYAVSKNINLVRQELESFEEMSKPTPEYMAYDIARVELAKKHAVKDENGKPRMENNHYIMEDKELFDKEVDKLQKSATHKKAVEEREKQLNEFKAFLEEDSDFEPYMVKIQYVPEDITSEQLAGIFMIIDDNGYKQ